jgi:hypothetical protein
MLNLFKIFKFKESLNKWKISLQLKINKNTLTNNLHKMSKKLLNFKARKLIHYSLLVCILLIQLLIAGFSIMNLFREKIWLF